MGFQKGKELEFVYYYDFATHGGTVGQISLSTNGINTLESGLVITDMSIVVGTTLTSGGAASVTLGHAGDADGYLVDFFADASSGAVLNRGDRAGALIWDDTNDHPIYYKISSSANAIPKIDVGTAALTAGAFKLYIKAYKPV